MVEQGADRRRLAGAVGAEEAEGLALVDVEVDVDDAAVDAVGLGELFGLDDRGHDRVLPAGAVPARSLQEAVDDDRDLLFDEGEDVAQLLERGARFGRPVGDRLEAALRDLAELAVDATRALEERVERLGRRAEVLAPVAPAGRAPDHPGARQDARGAADGATARLQRLGDLGRGLLRRLADEQPAPHAAGHRRHAVGGQDLAHLLDERALAFGHATAMLDVREVFSQY